MAKAFSAVPVQRAVARARTREALVAAHLLHQQLGCCTTGNKVAAIRVGAVAGGGVGHTKVLTTMPLIVQAQQCLQAPRTYNWLCAKTTSLH
eukprot:4750618-Amphidinium_carterae.1